MSEKRPDLCRWRRYDDCAHKTGCGNVFEFAHEGPSEKRPRTMSNRDEPTQSPLPLPLHAGGQFLWDAEGNTVATVLAATGWGCSCTGWQLAKERAIAIATACNSFPVMQKALQDIMHHLGAAASVTTNKTAAAWLRDLAATAASALDACVNKDTP